VGYAPAMPNDEQPPGPGALAGVRVLDLSRSIAGAWCTRVLADLDADVLMLEESEGHPARRSAPLAAWVLANKRSAALAIHDGPGGTAALADLVASADVVVSSLPKRAFEMSPLANCELATGAVLVHVTPHGFETALADVPGNDLTAAAMSGWASINGLAGGPPLKPSGSQASYCAGTVAALAAIAAHFRSLHTGQGDVVDVAETDGLAVAFGPAALRAQYTGRGPERPSQPELSSGPIPVADGHFALTLSRGHFWREAMTLLGLPDLAEDRRYDTAWFCQANKDAYTDRVEAAMRGWRKMDLFDELALRRVVAGPVLTTEELRANPHLRERGGWVSAGDMVEAIYPGPPFRMSRTPLTLRSPAPAPGGSEPRFLDRAKLPVGAANGQSGAGPLHGVRGIVLTQAWAGTFCTELLAFLGADVVQVEVRKRLDSWRGSYDAPMPARLADVAAAKHAWNCNPLYNSVNLNKRCVTLDLQDPRGLAVFKRLVEHAGFVAQNFSPRVLGNLGIAYGDLARIKPGVILCSLSAYGHSGPWENVPGIGGTIEPTSGMSALLGYEGGPPLNSGQMYPDAVAGYLGATAIAAALVHRARTGEGQYIDLSMQEANLAFIGDAALEFAQTGQQRPRMGNRHPVHAPHGMFETRDGGWLAVACETDEQWRALCAIVEGLDRTAARDERKQHEAAIEALIASWAASETRDAAVAALRHTGVIAAPVLEAAEVIASPHLRERGVAVEVDHPEASTWTQLASPFRFASGPGPVIRAAPLLGVDGPAVFAELLGMSVAEYDELEAAGVTGEGPPPGYEGGIT
jgi:crotonobetainyl-CoA:carnitine CoA-transferase CaiB-like acyl-CoA transferase